MKQAEKPRAAPETFHAPVLRASTVAIIQSSPRKRKGGEGAEGRGGGGEKHGKVKGVGGERGALVLIWSGPELRDVAWHGGGGVAEEVGMEGEESGRYGREGKAGITTQTA